MASDQRLGAFEDLLGPARGLTRSGLLSREPESVQRACARLAARARAGDLDEVLPELADGREHFSAPPPWMHALTGEVIDSVVADARSRWERPTTTPYISRPVTTRPTTTDAVCWLLNEHGLTQGEALVLWDRTRQFLAQDFVGFVSMSESESSNPDPHPQRLRNTAVVRPLANEHVRRALAEALARRLQAGGITTLRRMIGPHYFDLLCKFSLSIDESTLEEYCRSLRRDTWMAIMLGTLQTTVNPVHITAEFTLKLYMLAKSEFSHLLP